MIKLTEYELIDALADLFDEIELEDEEVDEVLRMAGYDPDEVSKRMLRMAEDALKWRREQLGEDGR